MNEDDALWRRLVFPSDYRNPTPAARYHLTVIGAGPAGLVTAIAAAGLGARVALVERHAMGGDCLNVGCVPSKTLLAAVRGGLTFALAMQRVRAVRARIARHDSVERYTQAGVDVFLGQGSFSNAHEIRVAAATLRTRRTVIATGARARIPPLPGLAQITPLSNETVLVNSGLDSLCFAVLVARLEDKLGVDPFSTAEDPSFPVTLGEFVRVYENAAR